MSNKKYLSYSLALALFAGHLYANENKVALDQIEVTSSSLGYNNVDAIKISTRNAELVRDILRDIPGVYVGGTNSFNQKIYMRGVNDRGLNITIDGARQRGNAFHHAADLVIDTDLIKAIDVSTGVNSVVGNTGALGGSVAFKTVSAKDLLSDGEVFGGKVKMSYNSNDERYSPSLMLYGRPTENFDLLGYFKYSDYDFGEDGNGKDIGGKGEDKSYLIKAGLDFLDSHRIELSYEHVEYKGKYPFRPEFGGSAIGPTDVVGRGGSITHYRPGERFQAVLPQEMGRDTYRFNWTYNPNELVDLELNAYYTDHYLKRDKMPSYKEAVKAGKASLMDAGIKTYGATLINTTRVNQYDLINHTIRYGIEFYESKSYLDKSISISAKNGKMSLKPNETISDDKATSYSLFVEDAIKIGGLTITPGVRFDYYELDTIGEGGGKGTGITSREDYDWTEVSPALALDYQFQNGLGLFASYSKVFRGPDPIESIRLTKSTAEGFKKSNALDPETGDAYEIGARFATEFGAGHTVSFLAKYFYTDYDNLINEFASPYGVGGTTRVNAGEATVDGVELAARAQFGNLGVNASYTHQSTDYKSQVKTAAGQSVYGGILGYSDVGDKYTFGMDYFIDEIDLLIGYSMIYFDSIKTDDGYSKPSFSTHDIYASWMPSGKLDGLELNVGIYNLFDEDYYSHTQRSFGAVQTNDWEPGRSVRASVSYKF
ncbi:MAG: TonB-dependent receptor [Campylobacter sp.]|nr:TonB-dependent receptor [Campylobacter sp.]